MKKKITFFISAIVLIAMLFTLTVWAQQTVEKKNPVNGLPLVEKNVDEKTMELELPLGKKATVTYQFSEQHKTGKVFDCYKDGAGNEFVLDSEGTIRKAAYFSVSPSRKTVSQISKADFITKDEGRQIVVDIISDVSDDISAYEETVFNSTGNGANKLYTYIYHEMIGEWKTMNKFRITLNAYGEVLTYLHTNDYDFSEIDVNALSAVTDNKLNAFVEESIPSEYHSYVIDDMHITVKDGEYTIKLMVSAYTSSNQAFYDSYEFFYTVK